VSYTKFKNRNQGCACCSKEKRNPKRLSDEEIKKLCTEKNLTFTYSEVKKGETVVYYICNKHKDKGIQHTGIGNIRKMRVGCPYCIGKNKTTEEFKKEIRVLNPNIIILGEYKTCSQKILCECAIDRHKWKTTPNRLLNGSGCPICGKLKSIKNSTKKHSTFIKEINKKNPTIKVLGEYTGVFNKILVECLECHHKWETTPDILLQSYSRKTGCPKCASYINENRIDYILNGCGYKIEIQKRFSDCRDKQPLPFDRYLPEFNILIEYDGEGHYKPIRRGNMTDEESLQALKNTQKHDEMKTKYCKDNNIPLIRIPYWEKDNMEYFLFTQLKLYIKDFDEAISSIAS